MMFNLTLVNVTYDYIKPVLSYGAVNCNFEFLDLVNLCSVYSLRSVLA